MLGKAAEKSNNRMAALEEREDARATEWLSMLIMFVAPFHIKFRGGDICSTRMVVHTLIFCLCDCNFKINFRVVG